MPEIFCITYCLYYSRSSLRSSLFFDDDSEEELIDTLFYSDLTSLMLSGLSSTFGLTIIWAGFSYSGDCLTFFFSTLGFSTDFFCFLNDYYFSGFTKSLFALTFFGDGDNDVFLLGDCDYVFTFLGEGDFFPIVFGGILTFNFGFDVF